VDLAKELHRQEENDKLRKDFARIANAFHQWLTETRSVFKNFLSISTSILLMRKRL